ncbi:hypothetical protein ACA910_021244 [Epithemia clementina (nom. ined.)]
MILQVFNSGTRSTQSLESNDMMAIMRSVTASGSNKSRHVLVFCFLILLGEGFHHQFIQPVESFVTRFQHSKNLVPWTTIEAQAQVRSIMDFKLGRNRLLRLYQTPTFYNDFEGYNEHHDHDSDDEDDDNDDDDDDVYNDLLRRTTEMDWRAFRRNLAQQEQERIQSEEQAASLPKSKTRSHQKKNVPAQPRPPSVCAENKELLQSQNTRLHAEFESSVWAHVTSVPEVGGLVVRMPLEVELHRNHKHSVTGTRLKLQYGGQDDDDDEINGGTTTPGSVSLDKEFKIRKKPPQQQQQQQSTLELWYHRASKLIANDLKYLTDEAAANGQIDATTLDANMADMLQLYLDHQETWQEVCLVLEKPDLQQQNLEERRRGSRALGRLSDEDEEDEEGGKTLAKPAITLVLNRPMAMKLTESLAQLVLYGGVSSSSRGGGGSSRSNTDNNKMSKDRPDLQRFMRAFGSECALYIGGPDNQDQPAELIHGIPGLPGSYEIAANTGIYRGGLAAAVDGVLRGEYKPLEFRFFVGQNCYEDAALLDLSCLVLGKYQPIACARSLALKQCISLPKPLWHEVLELCGGDMYQISQWELEKRDDLQIQIIDDDEEEDDDDDEHVDEDDETLLIVDELDELRIVDDYEDDLDDDEDYDEDDDYYRLRR